MGSCKMRYWATPKLVATGPADGRRLVLHKGFQNHPWFRKLDFTSCRLVVAAAKANQPLPEGLVAR